jgi:hypothetical protein
MLSSHFVISTPFDKVRRCNTPHRTLPPFSPSKEQHRQVGKRDLSVSLPPFPPSSRSKSFGPPPTPSISLGRPALQSPSHGESPPLLLVFITSHPIFLFTVRFHRRPRFDHPQSRPYSCCLSAWGQRRGDGDCCAFASLFLLPPERRKLTSLGAPFFLPLHGHDAQPFLSIPVLYSSPLTADVRLVRLCSSSSPPFLPRSAFPPPSHQLSLAHR